MREARILIYGLAGSGKTTLARKIAARYQLPLILADEQIGYLPATHSPWSIRPLDEQQRIARELTASPAWVLDSAYGPWREIAAARADRIIVLTQPWPLSFWRLLKRTVGRIRSGEQVCAGNQETWAMVFSRASFLRWFFVSLPQIRSDRRRWLARYGSEKVLLVGNLREQIELFQHLNKFLGQKC